MLGGKSISNTCSYCGSTNNKSGSSNYELQYKIQILEDVNSHLSDLSALMISSKYCNSISVTDFQSH
jgi:hypothetical protein